MQLSASTKLEERVYRYVCGCVSEGGMEEGVHERKKG
jgi:hypothetical protein